MIKALGFSMVVLAFAVACGGGEGGGGPDRTKQVDELTDDEVFAMCEIIADLFPVRSVTCDGQSAEVGTSVDGCISDFLATQCDATVAEAEDCAEALAEFPDDVFCEGTTEPPAPCLALQNC
jgi:hypothetical protein